MSLNDSDVNNYTCLCKSVSYQVTGKYALAVVCDCKSCAIYGGGCTPLAAFPPNQFKFIKGEDNLIKYESAPKKWRMSCKTCGSFIHNILPNGSIVVPTGGLSTPILPTAHIWYAERPFDATDSLPKHAGWPA